MADHRPTREKDATWQELPLPDEISRSRGFARVREGQFQTLAANKVLFHLLFLSSCEGFEGFLAHMNQKAFLLPLWFAD